MSATTVEAAPAPRRTRGRLGDRLLYVYTWAIIVWLCLPIAVMIAFGFNNTKGRLNLTWQGFTFKWYTHLFAVPDLTTALVNSLTIAIVVHPRQRGAGHADRAGARPVPLPRAGRR